MVVSHPKKSFISSYFAKFQAKLTNFWRFFKICPKLVGFHRFCPVKTTGASQIMLNKNNNFLDTDSIENSKVELTYRQ